MAKRQKDRRGQDMVNGAGVVGRFRKVKRFGMSVMFVFISIYCQKYNEEFEPQLNVYCVLRNDAPYQRVVVDRTYGMDEKSIYDLEDVQVILSGNGICDTLVEDSILGVFVTRDTFPVVHGQTYHLQVTAKGFDTLRGTTTVPDSFEIIYPEDGDTVTLQDTMVVKFHSNSHWVFFEHYFQDTILLNILLFEVNDTLFKLPIVLLDYGNYKITISALDTNYVDYYFENYDTYPMCGIENGIGLFGSFFNKTIDFFYLPRPGG